jgi:prepilin-type N-terminal cleavage/methylation domain-containing protein
MGVEMSNIKPCSSKSGLKKVSGGFSLIELLIAMVIFVTCMFGVISIFPSAMKAAVKSRNIMVATKIAQKEVERLKSMPWAELTPDNPAIQPEDPNKGFLLTINGQTSEYKFTVENYTETLPDNPNIKRIIVVVNYDYDPIPAPVQLETLLCNYKQSYFLEDVDLDDLDPGPDPDPDPDPDPEPEPDPVPGGDPSGD